MRLALVAGVDLAHPVSVDGRLLQLDAKAVVREEWRTGFSGVSMVCSPATTGRG